MLPSCPWNPSANFAQEEEMKKLPSRAEVKIPEARVNQNTTHKGTTDALYLSLCLLSNWSCHFHLSAQNPGLLLKNLGQLDKMSAELQRRIPVETKFGVGEHGLNPHNILDIAVEEGLGKNTGLFFQEGFIWGWGMIFGFQGWHLEKTEILGELRGFCFNRTLPKLLNLSTLFPNSSK